MRRNPVFWAVLALALLVGAVATHDRYRQIGQPFAGFWVMENLLVAVGGGERGGLAPFDRVRAVGGQLLASGREVRAEAERHPPGTRLRYVVYRRGQLVEAEVATRLTTYRDFRRFVTEGLLPGLLILGLGALVFALKPGLHRSWLFLGFCLVSYLVSVGYADAHTTYRFGPLFLTAWAFWPATFLHAALSFPQRRSIARRFPRVIWLPYVASGALAVLLQLPLPPDGVLRFGVVVGVAAAYWATALVLLVLAFLRAALAGATPVARQRGRVLAVAFAVGYLPPVLGTVAEVLLRKPVPYLDEAWKLNLLFPAALAYAMVRYDLFDLRSALRAGTVYSAVTGLVVLVYAGAIALLDLLFASFELSTSPFVPATVVALGVVLFLNPVYVRTQKLVDRTFFRERVDVQRTVERVSEAMTGLLDLGRVVELLTRTVDELLHPTRQLLLLHDERRQAFAPLGEDGPNLPEPLPEGSALPACLGRLRVPVARERVEEDPAVGDLRAGCLDALDRLGAELVVPVVFRERVTGLLCLGPKRSGAAYSTEDVRLLRVLVNQSALALDHARAYAALETANAELTAALRRVEILERIRANLAKFVSRTVHDLIEQAPEAPELDKREADVSVLFVDIVGYTRLSERLDAARLNELVERYFGAFLDEILRRGGDVNETAGDGLMVIFRDADPRRHARAAVKAGLGILRRTREINQAPGEATEPIAVHVGVNSGAATVGATKMEGRAGTRWTYTASGPVTNLAARLAALGEGDAMIVGWETRQRLAEEFAFEALGEQRLRNVEQPVRVFRLGA